MESGKYWQGEHFNIHANKKVIANITVSIKVVLSESNKDVVVEDPVLDACKVWNVPEI